MIIVFERYDSRRHFSPYAESVDCFPLTDDIQVIVSGHVETVVCLDKKKPNRDL